MSQENPLWQNGLRVSRENVVAHLTRIPEPKETAQEEIISYLSRNLIGQEKAKQAIARRVTLANAGFNDPKRPLSSMIFLGPTGVGKTEAAHALADYMFGDPDSPQLRVIDCQEYAQPHMTARLIGSPPGYVDGDVKTIIDYELLSKQNIILFDEIEKAHPNFHRLLLGIIEKRKLSIKDGAPLNFANSHIIMTSNVGAEAMQKARSGRQSIGFTGERQLHNEDIDEIGMSELRSFFRSSPEFLGRIDEIVVFDELESEHYEGIFWKFIEQKNLQIEDRMGSAAPFIAATHEAQSHLLQMIDKRYGARELRGILNREVFLKVADMSLSYNLGGRGVVMDVEDAQSVFYTQELEMFEERPDNYDDAYYNDYYQDDLIALPESIPMNYDEDKLAALGKIVAVLNKRPPQV
jgi:ATP-dependent Clp protease ATP-binding subunit ClpC